MNIVFHFSYQSLVLGPEIFRELKAREVLKSSIIWPYP